MKKLRNFLHYFFVPSERNNLRAKALHHDFLSFYLVLALLLVFSFKTFRSQITNVLGFATDITVGKLYELTNEERHKNNLPVLAYNETLAKAAELKAQDMFKDNYWSHYSPSGKSPWEFILTSGYKYEYAGENLAKNFLFSKDVVDAWMASSTHKDNLTRKDFEDVGFAVVNGVLNGEETTLVVQMLGNENEVEAVPAAQQPEVSANSPVLGDQRVLVSGEQKSVARFSSNFSYILLGFIVLVLVTDLYFAYKMNIFRITSKNLAHIIFLIFILAGFLFYITKGSII